MTKPTQAPQQVPEEEQQMMADLIMEAEIHGVDPIARACAMFMIADQFLRKHGIIAKMQAN